MILKIPQITGSEDVSQFNRDPQNYNAKLQIIDNDKKVAEFLVAIADSDEKKSYGLMNLDKLPQDFGMMFHFNKNQMVFMWMKDTRIALDMIFIDENDIIQSITKNAKPYSLDIISSDVEVKKVLEINGGLVDKFKIKIGQKIQ